MKLSNEDVREILHLLDASPYSELHLQTEHFKLSLRRGAAGGWTQESEVLSAPQLLKPAAASEPGAAPPRESPDGQPGRPGLVEVRTPLPGTFYRSPQPGAAPFVEVGSEVREDTVVCIVETMKLMNSIHAGAAGRIEEICLENGQFTEQDSVLMRIAPART